MPAAAVIPAPLAYIKVVAVKTFEVDCPSRHVTATGARLHAGAVRARAHGCDSQWCTWALLCERVPCYRLTPARAPHGAQDTHIYLEQIRVLKAG